MAWTAKQVKQLMSECELCGAKLVGQSLSVRRCDQHKHTNVRECIRICDAIAAFWGDDVCDAPIYPGAYLTEEDKPMSELVRVAIGWRKP